MAIRIIVTSSSNGQVGVKSYPNAEYLVKIDTGEEVQAKNLTIAHKLPCILGSEITVTKVEQYDSSDNTITTLSEQV